jgi:protein phosphatase PTC2/3
MTMIIVALLNGRTLDQWYDWIADRVQQNVGYETPEDLPQIFSESRILAAQHRSQFRNSNSAIGTGGSINLRGTSGFGALARVLGAGGITFNPAPRGGVGVLSFGHDDDDEYEDDEDDEDAGDTGEGGLFGVNRLKVSGNGGEKVGSLRHQLDDLENEMVDDEMDLHNDDDNMQADADPPRANITLPSPSEKQGMIDLDAVQDQSPTPTALSPHETGFASNGKTWIKVSGPTPLSEVTTIGSPLVPIPLALKDFKAPGKETPPPPALKKAGEIDEDAIPDQETGRVPDADAIATPGVGLTNGLLDKSEAVA